MLLNMTGEFINGRTAYEWGLVERVVPHAELMDTALGIAKAIAGSRRLRSAFSGSSRAPPATCRSKRACGARPTASAVAWQARTVSKA